MAQGSQSKLRQELDAMLRQRDQYSLALDTATDPQAAIRLQRTLDRLEDEIQGLKEALRAMPVPEAPDWEDEPATAIFDPADEMAPPEPPPLRPPAPPPQPTLPRPQPAMPVDEDEPLTLPVEIPSDFRKQSEIPTDVGLRAVEEAPPEQKPSQVVTVPGTPNPLTPDYAESADPEYTVPSAWGPETTEFGSMTPMAEPGAAQELPGPDPTIAVTAPPDPRPEAEPSTDPMPIPRPPARPMPVPVQQPPPAGARLRESSRALPDPLGPVVLDALEPPTGEIPKESGAPPDNPLALPGGPQPMGTGDVGSPFGAGAGSPFDISSDPPPEQSWSAAGKILLALVVGAFLTGVFWVLSQ